MLVQVRNPALISELMRARGLSAAQVAAQVLKPDGAAITKRYVNLLRSGRKSRMSQQVGERMAAVLGVEFGVLCTSGSAGSAPVSGVANSAPGKSR